MLFDLDNTDDETTIRARLDAGATLVACLCAQWCGSCRDYRDVFTGLARTFPQYCFLWVDVENQADRVDAFDVENFPTIVIEDAVATRFAGTLLPQRGILERLLNEVPQLPGNGTAPTLRAALAV
ncbi:thioredoxin family protein [Robbsia andropogonis]|uniref:thioredoxin family protein n=1 Tax=Robbsia andropogonis TaxID=28092 RepID=UPI0004663DC3